MDILAAMSIGGILVVVAIVLLFIWLNKRVNG
jgi:flagellar biogenesis protein FliO